MDKLVTTLNAIDVIAWTAVYVYIIVYQFTKKKDVMPYWALCLNLSWEVLFTILDWIYPNNDIFKGIPPPAVAITMWAVFDILIFISYCRNNWHGWQNLLKQCLGPMITMAVYVACFFQFRNEHYVNGKTDYWLDAFTAFPDNILMSIVFIYAAMSNKEEAWKPQCLLVGILKLVGTLNATITTGFFNNGASVKYWPYVLIFGTLIFIIDLAYCVYISLRRYKSKLNIWVDFKFQKRLNGHK